MIHQECSSCFDLGVIRTREYNSHFETLMLCDCLEGQKQTYALPRWEWKLGKLFARERCPVSWFKPETTVGDGGQIKMESLQKKIEYWRAKLKIAEGYWAQAKREEETA